MKGRSPDRFDPCLFLPVSGRRACVVESFDRMEYLFLRDAKSQGRVNGCQDGPDRFVLFACHDAPFDLNRFDPSILRLWITS
jgi:hypothetical protein